MPHKRSRLGSPRDSLDQVAREGTSGPLASARRWARTHPVAITIIGSLVVGIVLIVALWSKRGEFAAALGDAPIWILGLAVLLQLIWLLARSEAWHVCVGAAGGAVSRRRLYRASSVGYLGNIFNANFGAGVRIAALRRSAPDGQPLRLGADRRRAADHRDRGSAGGALFVHPRRPARTALVAAPDLRRRRRARDRRHSPTSPATGARASGRGSR